MNIYLTLDYELFLGDKTGTPENCLIRPMDALCEMASEHNVKFTIFADATYLLRLSQLKEQHNRLAEHYSLVVDNLQKRVKEGHDVQLHIHPQWMYSQWDDEKQSWTMDKTHYKLSDLVLEEAKKLIKDSKELLDSIVGYKTHAFRAGGFCLDDFYKYSDVFKDLEILIDSSVVRKQCVLSEIHYYDYREIPQKQIYNFSDSIKVEHGNGPFTELSISSFSCSPLYYLSRVKKLRKNYCPKLIYKDGESISDGNSVMLGRIKKLLSRYNTFCSIDAAASCYLNEYYKGVKQNGYDEMVLIGHPKHASDFSINNLERFIVLHKEDRFLTISSLLR